MANPSNAASVKGGFPVWGALLGLVMAGAVSLLSVEIRVPHVSYAGAYAPIIFGVYGVLPLVVLGILTTVGYAVGHAPARAYGWLWLPTLAVVVLSQGVFAIQDGRTQVEEAAYDRAHPNIEEVHVNLSGRDQWLDPESIRNDSRGRSVLAAEGEHRFITLTRYGRPYYAEDRMLAYQGARLAPDFKEMPVYFAEPEQSSPTPMPVVVAGPYPDTKEVLARQPVDGRNEAEALVYFYYHYADHIEVVPTLRLSGSRTMDFWRSKAPLLAFHWANLGAKAIVRLEIDGQAMDVGGEGIESDATNAPRCNQRNYASHAFMTLDKPEVVVRWQRAEAHPKWHTATVRIPSFASGERPDGRPRNLSVMLYLQDDGPVSAERFQEFDLLREQLILRTTGPVPALSRKPPCGTVRDSYTEAVKVIPH